VSFSYLFDFMYPLKNGTTLVHFSP
jgi:hypothetical protein